MLFFGSFILKGAIQSTKVEAPALAPNAPATFPVRPPATSALTTVNHFHQGLAKMLELEV